MEKTPRIRKGADVSENIAALHTEPLSFLGIWFAACFPKAGDKFDNFVPFEILFGDMQTFSYLILVEFPKKTEEY